MDEWPRRPGQIATMREPLPPEALRGGWERPRTQRVAHPPQPHRQMRFNTLPVTPDAFTPTRHLRYGVAIKAGGYRRRIDRPIRLGKFRRAAHAHPPMPAQEPAPPDRQDQRRGGGEVTVVIGQRFQRVRPLAIGAVSRRPDLPVRLRFGLRFGGQ